MRPLLKRQHEAVDAIIDGLANHDGGRLVMVCGTGKTFTSLRIAERIVPEDGRILFGAPTIALVSQARREWLRHTTRPLDSLVVCSDPSAGDRREDIRRSELECPVTTDPRRIAKFLSRVDNTRAVFSNVPLPRAGHRVAEPSRCPPRPSPIGGAGSRASPP